MADAVPEIAWGALYAARRAAHARWPDHFRLPVRKSPGRVVASVCPPGGVVLDVGAGDRSLRDALARHAPGVTYRSLDPEPAAGPPHDYRALAEVREPVDVVACLEVLEHVPLAEGVALLRAAAAVLRPGGACVCSTPSVFTPGRFLRDATHRTPYAWDELAGVCALAGLTVESLCRTWNAPAVPRAIRLWLAAPLHRYLGSDFADSVCAVARRPAGGATAP